MTFNRGLILGKFYPPHTGHLHLISEAKKQCNHLTVIIATLQREEIAGSLRYSFLKELILDPNIEIIWIQDENPQFPEEHLDFWEIWRKSIQRVLREPVDVLFSSEQYGDPLSKVLGTKHICIDLERNSFPVSATLIRNSPGKFWDFIPRPLRPYFLKRIVITGSESVGKSTLASNLAKHFQTSFVPEFAREYLDKKGRYVIAEDIIEIGKGHLASEISQSIQANKLLLLDTDHITTKIYSDHYFHNCPTWVTERADGLIYDGSILLDIDVPWIADTQRDLGNEREYMKKKFEEEMHRSNRDYVLVSGTFPEREKKAIEIIESILKEPMNPLYFNEEQLRLRSVQ
jgi:HTH-type transcriptional repressor of NAD biosynthesis genes